MPQTSYKNETAIRRYVAEHGSTTFTQLKEGLKMNEGTLSACLGKLTTKRLLVHQGVEYHSAFSLNPVRTVENVMPWKQARSKILARMRELKKEGRKFTLPKPPKDVLNMREWLLDINTSVGFYIPEKYLEKYPWLEGLNDVNTWLLSVGLDYGILCPKCFSFIEYPSAGLGICRSCGSIYPPQPRSLPRLKNAKKQELGSIPLTDSERRSL